MKPNEAPDRPWKSISMDFITDLPLSEEANAILIVIDRLTKMAHLIPCTKDMDAKQFQEMFLREIFRLYALPRDIITDRGSIFTSDLWKETTQKLGIERRLSTAFHLQTDGQTERPNSTLEQYLRAYGNYQQDDWKELLPMAEFAYNNGYQESTKHTPFFANYGTNPEYQAIGHLIQGRMTSPEDMSQLHDTLQAEMTEAQMRHKEYYDAQRKPDPNLQQRDMVWLLQKNIRTTRPCRKLDYKKIGPFNILARIGSSAYKLDLPTSMRIHNTFHISLLELYNNNKLPSQRSEPPPPILIEGEPEYELEEIVDSCLHYNKVQYRAKWIGDSPEHDKTWYPAENFENADLSKRNFHSRYTNKPHLDQTRGTGERRRARLSIADTEPGRSPSTPTKDNNPPRKLGNHDRLAGDDPDKPAIPLTLSQGRSGTKAKGTRCTTLEGVLQRQLLGTRQRESGTRVVLKEIQSYAIRLEPAIRNKGTSTGRGPRGPNIQKPATKGKAFHQKVEGMLQRQVPSTRPIQSGRRVLPAEGRDKKGPFTLAPIPPRPEVPSGKERSCGDTTGEGGERKNPTRRRCPTKANSRAAGTEGTGVKKREQIPAQNNGQTDCDGKTSGRRPKASQDGRRNRIQPIKVEERGGRRKKREPGARASEQQTQKGAKKSWVEVARLGQLVSRDRC